MKECQSEIGRIKVEASQGREDFESQSTSESESESKNKRPKKGIVEEYVLLCTNAKWGGFGGYGMILLCLFLDHGHLFLFLFLFLFFASKPGANVR